MRKLLVALLLALVVSPIWALQVGTYFQQGIEVHNDSSAPIFITDTVEPDLNKLAIDLGLYFKFKYDSDQFTNPAGQSFGHVISIITKDNQEICKVTTHLDLTQNSSNFLKPVSSDETKCITSVSQEFDGDGQVFLSVINVYAGLGVLRY